MNTLFAPTPICANEFLPAARALAREFGPLVQAGDHTPAALVCAQVNAELLIPQWCPGHAGQETVEVYYRRPSGSHGWMCATCRKITQTG